MNLIFKIFNKKVTKVFFDYYDPELNMHNVVNETMKRMRDNIRNIEREAFTARLNRHQDYINAVLNKK